MCKTKYKFDEFRRGKGSEQKWLKAAKWSYVWMFDEKREPFMLNILYQG